MAGLFSVKTVSAKPVSPPAASWPDACATFARCRKAHALTRRTRLRRPHSALSLKIAQPFMAGFTVRECSKSRQGRKKCSAVPTGLDFKLMTFNPAINGWAIFSEDGFSEASFTACRVMARRLRDVCALPESSCSDAPDAAASSALGLVFENSPAIYGWVHGSGMFQVPPGTKDPCGWPPLRTATLFFCRPSRDFYLCLTRYPAMNGWAIVIASLHNFVACAPACLGLRGQAPSPLPLCRRSKFGQLSGA